MDQNKLGVGHFLRVIGVVFAVDVVSLGLLAVVDLQSQQDSWGFGFVFGTIPLVFGSSFLVVAAYALFEYMREKIQTKKFHEGSGEVR